MFCYRKSVSSRLSFHAGLPNYLKTRIGIVTGMLARVSHTSVTCLVELIQYLNVHVNQAENCMILGFITLV